MDKQKNEQAPLRYYKQPHWYTLVIYACLLLVIIFDLAVLFILYNVRTSGNRLYQNVNISESMLNSFILVLVTLVFLWALWVMRLIAQSHLAIYEHGIEFRMGKRRVYSRWEDLSHIEVKGSRRRYTVGIRTNSTELREADKTLGFFLQNQRKDFIPLSFCVHVPTYVNVKNGRLFVHKAQFAKTPIGQDLLKHAPHLFEPEKAKAKNG